MAQRKIVLFLLLLFVSGTLLGLTWLYFDFNPASEASADFLDQHWQRPLLPQGDPPAAGAGYEDSLDAKTCGGCHVQQYADWSTSRHSRSMGAGILWQMHIFDQEAANKCLNCHAPLAEQKALVALERHWPSRPEADLPGYVPANLHLQGLSCAACHLRAHRVYGPPARSGLSGNESGLPHGGFVATRAFEDSRFCASCHQFAQDGPRLNGKLREDIYNQWRASVYPERGETCQTCHMPERRHLWRGIGDADMVRRALAIDLKALSLSGGQIQLQLRLGNAGAGHHFPAYLVPRVEVRVELVDAGGRSHHQVLRHSLQWRASVDLLEEQADTRLAAGETRQLQALLPTSPEPDWSLRLTVDVAPKEHYERVYEDMLSKQAHLMRSETLKLLRQALAEARASRYCAVTLNFPLPTLSAPVAN